MTKKKHTKLKISELQILTDDPSWTEGIYPIDETPENDLLIGLTDPPETPIPEEPPAIVSNELIVKQLSPFPEKFGAQQRPTRIAYPKDITIPGTSPGIQIEKLLPEHIRTGRNGTSLLEPFLYNSIDKWMTAPDLDSIGGYIGDIVDNIVDENYIIENTEFATKNQLQPSVRSFVTGHNVDLNMTWQEMLGQMKLSGLDVDNKTDKFFATKKFSFQPPINPEKFVNYRYFYWTKSFGRWDVTINPDDEFGLILINGSLVGYGDIEIGDIVRLNGYEFVITDFDILNNIITIHDETERVYLAPLIELNNTLIGHDRPAYNVQAPSDYISNGWINNNHWVHLDELSVDEIEGFSSKVFVKAKLPIIELLPDVILDTSVGYTKCAVPNVLLYPLQYVDFSRTGIPVNVDQKLIGYDGFTGAPIYEDKIGTIPVVKRPVLEYLQGDVHLNGDIVEIDEELGFKAVKLTANSTNYIFRNGLIDDDHTDMRNGRFYVYLIQASIENLEQKYTHIQSILSDQWIINHNLGYVPIVRVFLVSGSEILPSRIESNPTTTTVFFTNPMVGTVVLT